MSFEELQAAWQSQSHGPPPKLDTVQLLQQIRREHQELQKILFRRDMSEIVVGVLLTAFFLSGAIVSGKWSLGLLAAGCLWVALFLVVDRWLQAGHRPASGDALQSYLDAALNEVQHQIWLLRNVVWWYLAPLMVGMLAVIGDRLWNLPNAGWGERFSLAMFMGICGMVFWGVYWLNERAVRLQLIPRRDELQDIRDGLNP